MARKAQSSSAKKAPARRRKRSRPEEPTGLAISQVGGPAPETVRRLGSRVAEAGGAVLAPYRDPVGGHWLLLVAVPLDRVEPTPYQRDPSPAHVEKIARVIEKLDRFLDPIILCCPAPDGRFWTPNGNHRLQALRGRNARSVIGLLVPEAEIAHQILALNTEKAYNLRERALGVLRLLRDLAASPARDGDGKPWSSRSESSLAFELEDPALLTLGLAYEKRGRFAGGAYQSVLRRVEAFLEEKLARALEIREERAAMLLELDDAVNAVVQKLKDRGFQSPYLKAFAVARIHPLRFHKGDPPPCEKVLERMLRAAERFDVEKIRESDIARSGGPPESAEG